MHTKDEYHREAKYTSIFAIFYSIIIFFIGIRYSIKIGSIFLFLITFSQPFIVIPLAKQTIKSKKYSNLIIITIINLFDLATFYFLISISTPILIIRIGLFYLFLHGTLKSNNLFNRFYKNQDEKEDQSNFKSTQNNKYNSNSSSNSNNHSDTRGDNSSHQKTDEKEPSINSEEYHYKILNLKHGANFDEIKKAYLELIKKYHPDKVDSLGDEFIELALKRTQELVRAFQFFKKKFGIR